LNQKLQQVIKESKDSEYTLVSNKNFSKTLPSNSSVPDDLKVLHLWRHSQKIRNPQPKHVFIASYKTCRVC